MSDEHKQELLRQLRERYGEDYMLSKRVDPQGESFGTLEIGCFYMDAIGWLWACVDWNDSHGLTFQCYAVRDGRGHQNMRALYDWFEPDGRCPERPPLLRKVSHDRKEA